MSLRKRGNIWWIGFTAPSGQRIRQSTGTSDRQAAQEYHDQLKAQLWSQAKLGQTPTRLFDELATLWLKKKQEKRSIAEDAYKITFYRRYFGGRPLQQITRQAIEGCLEQFENPCTYNRYMQLMRSMFRMAREEGWIEAIPAFRLRREPKRRVRWLKPQEAIRLIEELPERHRPEARFALATGLRKGNIINLEWSQVDMVAGIAWIHPDQSKSGNAIPVPLNSDAREIIRGQIGKHERLVFAGWRGISQDVWKGALKRAGIERLRWHDLRHTWASWHVQSGTDLNVLLELGGWSCIEMVRKYAHLGQRHLVEHAERVAVLGTKLAQRASPSLAAERDKVG